MKWIKDNDQEIETNDLPATIAKCKELGWKQADEPKKRGRPAKESSKELN